MRRARLGAGANAAIAAAVLATGCYCSHAPALPDRDASAGRDAAEVDAGPRYATTLRCDDPLLWSRDPTAALRVEEPLECAPFHEPIHAFELRPVDRAGLVDAERACWRVVGDDGCGWSVGATIESEAPALRGYVRGGCRRVAFEARVQTPDGRLLVGTAEYVARSGGSSALEVTAWDAPPVALLYGGGRADGSGLHGTPREVAVDALRAAVDVSYPRAPGLAWISEPGERVLGVIRYDDVDVRREVPLDASGVAYLAGSGRSASQWAVAVVGETATVVRFERDVPEVASSTFPLGAAPAAIGVRGDVLLGVVGERLRAWTIDGSPIEVTVGDAVQTIVSGPLGARAVLARGAIAVPVVESGRIGAWSEVHAIDPVVGPLLSAHDTVWVGRHGLERPPRDGGPTLARAEEVFGGPIAAALVDSYSGSIWLAVERPDGRVVLQRTDPSYEGCD